MKRAEISLTEGKLFSNIIFYTVPIILTSLLQLLFNAADLVVVGRYCGSICVGAVGATGSLINLLIHFFVGLSTGTGVVVAQSIGAGDSDYITKTVHTAMMTALIGGVVLTAVGVLFCQPLLRIMETPENVLPLSVTYMRIYFAGSLFSLVYNYASAILRAGGDTKGPLIYLTLAGIVNVVLNIIFVTVFHMDIAGVALATIISQAISAILVVIALINREDATRLLIKNLRIYGEQLKKIMKIGLPAGIQGSLFAISNVLVQSSVNSFGDVFVAGNSAASNLEGFIYVAMNAFYQTTLNFVAQNYGARKFDRVKKAFLICLISVLVTGLVLGMLCFVFGRQLLGIYITDSAKAIEYGIIRLSYIGLAYFLCGLMEVTTGAIRGIGSSFITMVVSLLCVCGMRVAWIFTVFKIPQFHTPGGLFAAYPITWFLTFVVQLIVLYFVFKNKKRDNLSES